MTKGFPRSRFILLAALAAPLAARADPDALWKIVHGACVPHVLAHAGAAPCAAVDLAHRYALLKDRAGVEQYLLIATDRISGIESPALLAPVTPNFWQYAWAARGAVEVLAPRRLGTDEVGLAINPPWGRTQDQFHIHIDCVKTVVSDQLRGLKLGAAWTAIRVQGVAYQARQFDMRADPFLVMAPEVARQHTTLADWSLATIGAHVLLATRTGHAEDLLDHSCAG